MRVHRMSGDRRWTGGIANREWQRGAQPTSVTDRKRIAADVAAYLADCRQHQQILSPRYHPTVTGALKTVFHRSHEEAAVIRAEYRHAMRSM